MLQAPKGLNQESSSDQQDDGEPNFSDHQEPLQSRSPRADAGASDTLMQRVTKPGLGTLHCRSQSKKNDRNKSQNERERPYVPIQANLAKTRQAVRSQSQEQR